MYGMFAKNGLLQLSMDGPSVNWKFHKSVQDALYAQQDCQNISLINIGSCGLHIIHNACKAGTNSTGWKLDHLLFCMYQLFKDTPARREDYSKRTGELSCTTFPLKFCKTRWVENVPVLERAISLLNNLAKYVKAVYESKCPDPSTKSFEAVKEATNDPLIFAKLHFSLSVSKQVTCFLLFYQTNKPVLPFLANDLFNLLKSIMARFVKRDIMDKVTSIEKLLKVKVSNKDSHLLT